MEKLSGVSVGLIAVYTGVIGALAYNILRFSQLDKQLRTDSVKVFYIFALLAEFSRILSLALYILL